MITEKQIRKHYIISYIVTSFMLLIFLCASLFIIGYTHEAAHKVIYGYYGLDSRIEFFSHFPDIVTIAEGPCPVEACRQAQSNVDAFGYPLISISGVALMIFSILFLKSIGNDYKKDLYFHKHLQWQQEIVRASR